MSGPPQVEERPDTTRATPLREKRILVCAPIGNDARLSVDFLAKAGLSALACADLEHVCREMDSGCGALLLAEESLGSPQVSQLVAALERQPAWSDVPIALITTSGIANEDRLRRLAAFGAKGNVTLLERPFRPSTLVSALEVALRARERQYQVRKLLAEVRERETRFRRMSDAAPVLIWMTGPDKQCTWLNRGWLRFVGRSMAEELGEGRLRNVHPEDRVQYGLTFDNSVDNRKPFEVVYRLRRHDAQWRWMLERSTPLFEASGDFVGYIGSCIDITDIQQAQVALGHHARRSSLVSQIASELLLTDTPQPALPGIFQRLAEELGATYFLHYMLHDNGERLVLATSGGLTEEQRTRFAEVRVGETLCGLSAQHREPVVWSAAQSPDFKAAALMRMVGARVYACQPLQITNQLFGTLAFAASNRDHFSNEELRFVATVADLVAASLERNRLLGELRAARDAAEKASRAKDDFLAALSHELRTPLNPVLLLATEAAANPELPAEVRADFEQIAKGVTLEARLIDDLLDLTRITRGKTMLELAPVDAHSVLRDALGTTQPDIDQKQLKVSLDLRATESRVIGDAVRLQQVFWNVLKNAAKFTPPNGSITIVSAVETKRRQLVITVEDTGVGMSDEELGRVFQAFSQGDHANRNGPHRFGGLGLGLAISKMLIELHTGSVEASSAGPGKGSTFVIRLPLAAVAAYADTVLPATRGSATPDPTGVVRAASPGRLLLVEDHEPTRNSLELLLRRRGFEVQSAGSIAEAEALAAGHSFDFLLSDIGLPDGSGYDLMGSLRKKFAVRGIALSGYGMETDIEQSRRAGFSAHLIKPVNIQSLDAALQRVRTIVLSN